MKYLKLIARPAGALLIAALLATSCSKNDENSFDHYVSKELLISYTRAQMRTVIDIVSASVPDLMQMKPFIESDVDIYRIVYSTSAGGKTIKASGVMCVPSTPGVYPVLSFQNGTNTLFSNAPSMSATGLTYQLVEIISSMGYVVLIPDYPGFGESEDVVHPYLVKEPTVKSIVDMFSAVVELTDALELEGVELNNDYYLIGYSQGGWATLALHKALELEYSGSFNLKGSVCGAGPYDISLLFNQMTSGSTYSVPAYIAYIINAYKAYNQFTNPVADILKAEYAAKLPELFNGQQSIDQISSQLTNSIAGLFTSEFLAGYATSAKYSPVRSAMEENSVSAWKTMKPLFLVHGGSDTQVNPVTTETLYSGMLAAGTSTVLCKKLIVPGADHGDGLIPCMIQGVLFLNGIKDSK